MASIEFEVSRCAGIVKRCVSLPSRNWGCVACRSESDLGGKVHLPVGQRCVREGW